MSRPEPSLSQGIDGLRATLPLTRHARAARLGWTALAAGLALLTTGLLLAAVPFGLGAVLLMDRLEAAYGDGPCTWVQAERTACVPGQPGDDIARLDLQHAALQLRRRWLLELHPDLRPPELRPLEGLDRRVAQPYGALPEEPRQVIGRVLGAPPWPEPYPLPGERVDLADLARGPEALRGLGGGRVEDADGTVRVIADDDPIALEADRRTRADLLRIRSHADWMIVAAAGPRPERSAVPALVRDLSARVAPWTLEAGGAALVLAGLVLLVVGGLRVRARRRRRVVLTADLRGLRLDGRSWTWDAVDEVDCFDRIRVRLRDGGGATSPPVDLPPDLAGRLARACRLLADEARPSDDPDQRVLRDALQRARDPAAPTPAPEPSSPPPA